MSGEAASEDGNDWFASYMARVTELMGEAARVNADLAGRWGARSMTRGDEWTIDTVTADCIEAWEHLTPLAGRGIDLWLEGVQQALRTRRPS
jgi:hypothetical protein